MNKRSIIATVRGDHDLAEDWARKYIALYDVHFKSMNNDDDLELDSTGHAGE